MPGGDSPAYPAVVFPDRMDPVTDPTVIARIGKPHGLNGEVTVQLHTDEPERRLGVGTVIDTEATTGTGVPRALTIRSTRVHNGVWLVGFEEIPDRTGAESLRGTRLVVDADELADDGPAEDDVFGEAELVGLRAVSPSGEVLGEVASLEVGAVQDRLGVRLPDGRLARVPFVEALVPEVDVEGGTVVLDLPAGLLDLAE